MKLTEAQSIEVIDYMFGGDESDVSLRTVRVLKTRKHQICMCAGNAHGAEPHKIDVGTSVVREKAIVDGSWCSSYVCVSCAEEMADRDNLFGQFDDDEDYESDHCKPCSVCAALSRIAASKGGE